LERPGRKRKKFAPAGEGEVRQAKANAKTYNEDSSEDEEIPKHVRSDNSENKDEMDEEQRDEGKRSQEDLDEEQIRDNFNSGEDEPEPEKVRSDEDVQIVQTRRPEELTENTPPKKLTKSIRTYSQIGTRGQSNVYQHFTTPEAKEGEIDKTQTKWACKHCPVGNPLITCNVKLSTGNLWIHLATHNI
jgi:rubrerythrin